MAVTIYHNPRCSTSRNTLALIEGKGIKPKVVLYLDTPLDAEGIEGLLKKLKLKARQLLRKKEATPLGIDPDKLSEAQLIAAMVENPILIERPVVVSGTKAVLGRPPEKVLEIL